MSRLIGTSAVSVLLHGGLALALLALPRWSTLVPPRVLYVVLPAFDVGETRLAAPAGEVPEQAGEGRTADARAGRLRKAPASGAVSAPAPRRAERGEAMRMQVEAATSPAKHSTPSGAAHGPRAGEMEAGVTRSAAAEAPLPQRAAVPSEPVPEPAARPGAPMKVAETPTSVPEPRASAMDGARASPQATRDAPAAGGVAGMSAARYNDASAGGASSGRGLSGGTPLDSGTGTGARGLGPASARVTGGGAVASIPGSGEGMGALARPRYSDNPRPAYPWSARVRGEEGTVLLTVLVDARGRVSDLRVERSSGSPALDDAAIAAVRQWRFHPGVQGTEPVNSWVRVPVRFQLQN